VTLEGPRVRLEPLAKAHWAGLAEVGLDEELWRWIPVPVRTVDEMAAYIETALGEQERGISLPSAIVEKATGRAIGCTRYGNIDCTHHGVEIGWTWVARDWQRAARIGAREEGTFRNHMITASGRIRHTVDFSIVDSEWPGVKTRLESMLDSRERWHDAA
jgi:RimJ/RimL family protein N-acetyltransferase